MRHDTREAEGNLAALQTLALRTLSEERSGASLSGYERNHLFRNSGGAFSDVSGVSGLDDPADGRGFAILDYDRDGRLDVAIVNANAPWVELFRNQIGCHSGPPAAGRMIALRFVGGNHRAQASEDWSGRDGFGATVTIDLGDGRTLLREHRAGEGFAAQNSATLVIGIGDRQTVPKLTVRWPSGRTQTASELHAGTLLIVHENPALSGRDEAFERLAYSQEPPPLAAPPRMARPRLELTPAEPRAPAALRLYTTMATWCAACKGELRQFSRLRETFPEATLAMAGVPIDTSESMEQVKAWGASHRPVYDLLEGLPAHQVDRVKDLVIAELGLDAVPASLVTDEEGNLLLAQWGPPSISKIRELLRAQETKDSPQPACSN